MAGSKLLDWLETEAGKQDMRNQQYPIIWKKERCLRGECKAERTEHRWSLPLCTPNGLASECYDCQKIKFIKVQKDGEM